MAIKASGQVLSTAYTSYRATCWAIKQLALSAANKLQAETVDSDYILLILASLLAHKETLQDIAATPGLAAWAQGQENDPAYNITAEHVSFMALMTAAGNWITSNIPKDASGYLLVNKFDASGNISPRSFTTVQTANLVVALQAIASAVA